MGEPAAERVTIHVRFLGPLRRRLGVPTEDLDFGAPVSVRDLLERLIADHGEDLRDTFFNQYGWMDPRLWVLVDGESAGARQGLDTPLSGQQDVQVVLG